MAITSFKELSKVMDQLPPRRPGFVRVFRGQTKDYGKMIASSARRPLVNAKVWLVYARRILGDAIGEPYNGGKLDENELQILFIWLKAVAQHYGPGSGYLDVSHSVETALWFALHETLAVRGFGAIGPAGPSDSTIDCQFEQQAIGYGQYEEKGYLYVFDVPKWSGTELPKPGMLVDLSEAPPAFSSCARMRAQTGCLIYAENSDLASFYVPGTPLEVRRPMDGAMGLNRGTADLFPSPSSDPWYDRFLRIPMSYIPSEETGLSSLRRQIPVTLYFSGESPDYEIEMGKRDLALYPPLIHSLLVSPKSSKEETPWYLKTSFKDATAIVLETPQLTVHPPGDSDLWNHEIVSRDIADNITVFDFVTKRPSGSVDLRNVLIEFSHLEEIGWERAEEQGITLTMIRAIWLLRRDAEIAATFVLQEFPSFEPTMTGSVVLRYDAKTNRLHCRLPGDASDWQDSTNVAPITKPIFVALSLLRELSPGPKASPMPSQVLIADSKKWFLVRVTDAGARLCRTRSGHSTRDWFVMRDSNGDPFTETTRGYGVITLPGDKDFIDIRLREIQGQIAGIIGNKK